MDKTIDILLMTYNQEKYVREAMEGIAMQRVDEDVKTRIIVADDCSTDGTMDIIKTFALKHNAEWVFLPNDKNLGIAGNYKRAIAATTADYVAILEGDDYWTDAYRLQKHIDYLSTHADCVMTANDYMEYSQERGEWMWKPISRKYLLLREMIANYCLANLSARVYRGDVLRGVGEKVFEYGEKQRGEATDYYMTMDVLRHGYGYVLNEVMSVYRVDTHTNVSKREMTYEENIERGRICYKQMHEMLGSAYESECYSIYTDAIQWTTREELRYKEQKWAEYIPPIMSRIIWHYSPILWYFLKHTIRVCIPNKMYKSCRK